MLDDPRFAFEQDDEVIGLITIAEKHIADHDPLFSSIAA